MKHRRSIRFAGLAVCLGAGALANVAVADNGPNYTYGEIGFARLDIDDLDADGDLLRLRGSVAITDMFHLFGSYDDGEVDAGRGSDADVTTMEFGAGINYAVSDTVDLVGRLSWVNAEIDAGRLGGVDDDGLALSGGVRAMLAPQFELNGGISYTDIEDSEDTALEIGAVYSFTDMLAVTADASIGEEISTYGIGLRLYFNR